MRPRNLLTGTITFLIPVLALIAFSSSCALREGKPTAEQAVAKFHQQLDAEQYHEIYTGAHQGFRDGGGPEEQCSRFLQAVHRKLGEVRQSNQTGFFFNVNTEGYWVKLVYNTEFRNGPAVEQFIWQISGGQALLYRYDIHSNALVTMDSPPAEVSDDVPVKADKRLATSRR